MNKKVLVLLVGVVILFFAGACKKTEYNLYSNISGTVIDAENGEPIGMVTVTLSPGGLNAYTGSDGHFEFKEIDAQHYTIWVQKTGYGSNNKSIEALSGETVSVNITMKKQ